MSETAGQGQDIQPPIPQMPASPGIGAAMPPGDWQAAMAQAFPGQAATPATSITDPTMSSADWARLSADPRYAVGANGGGNPLGVPSSQWGPFGLTPPPGSPAARDYWMNLQYGGSPPPGAVPMDPSQYTNLYEQATANTSHFGGGVQIPVGVQGSQFNPTPGNPNFTITPGGYGQLTDVGQANLGDYAQNQLQQVYANAVRNRSGISGFMGSPAGAMAVLGFPALVGGAGALAAGAAGAAGAGGATSGLGGLLTNPLTSLGLPSWTNWIPTALKGVNLLQQLTDSQGQQQ